MLRMMVPSRPQVTSKKPQAMCHEDAKTLRRIFDRFTLMRTQQMANSVCT
jgi:hypothetical protein